MKMEAPEHSTSQTGNNDRNTEYPAPLSGKTVSRIVAIGNKIKITSKQNPDETADANTSDGEQQQSEQQQQQQQKSDENGCDLLYKQLL